MIKALTISRAVARFFNGGGGGGGCKIQKSGPFVRGSGANEARVNAPVRAQGAKPLEAGINTIFEAEKFRT